MSGVVSTSSNSNIENAPAGITVIRDRTHGVPRGTEVQSGPMLRYDIIALLLLVSLWGCGGSDNSQIVGLMISPVSTATSVGSSTDFSAYVQYVDHHQTPVSNATWSIQGTAALIDGIFADGSVSVKCIRRSDYFGGGYVPDTVMGKAEVSGQTYIGTASLVCE
jgi:hypothetical protein